MNVLLCLEDVEGYGLQGVEINKRVKFNYILTFYLGERYYDDCMQSVYRSGRTSFMIWGAIGWGYKSLLIFLFKKHGKRGINSKDYAEQVLKAIVRPFLAALEEENTIFIEDGASIYNGAAIEVRKRSKIKEFPCKFWPPSSSDLNPIEKVWRWMKARISQTEPFLQNLRI